MPKLLIKLFGYEIEDECELEQARYLLNFDERFVVVEGQNVNSYDELVRIAALEKYRNRQLIEVVLVPKMAGG